MAGDHENTPRDAAGDDHDIFDGAGSVEEEPTTRPRRKRRGLRIAIVSLVTVALLSVAAVAGYVAFLNWRVSNNVTHAQLLPLPESPIRGEDSEVTPTTPPERAEEAGDALNILVVGSDSRDVDAERGRSDVMVLMHISDDRDRVDLVHFPRDYFVEIPGSNNKNKLNAAYAFGGTPLLVQTLQPLVGVPIDHVVITDFESFKSLTDAVGGVEVSVAEGSPDFAEGTQWMDGETALKFVRERYALSQGDISRGQRQQAFIKALMLQVLTRETFTNPARLADVVDAGTTNLTVDDGFSVGDMRDLGWSMRNVRGGDINFVTAPWSGIGSDDYAGSIVIPHEAQLEVLREHLRSDSMAEYTDDVSPQQGFG